VRGLPDPTALRQASAQPAAAPPFGVFEVGQHQEPVEGKGGERQQQKAYKLLERDSIIETKGYRGTYVQPKAKTNCKFNLQEWTLRRLSEQISELREAGVTDSEIRNAFVDAISRQTPANRGAVMNETYASL
jgi:hypothetical protein